TRKTGLRGISAYDPRFPEQPSRDRNYYRRRVPFFSCLFDLGAKPDGGVRPDPLFLAGLSHRRCPSLDRARRILRLAGCQPNGVDVSAVRAADCRQLITKENSNLSLRSPVAHRASICPGNRISQPAVVLSGISHAHFGSEHHRILEAMECVACMARGAAMVLMAVVGIQCDGRGSLFDLSNLCRSASAAGYVVKRAAVSVIHAFGDCIVGGLRPARSHIFAMGLDRARAVLMADLSACSLSCLFFLWRLPG